MLNTRSVRFRLTVWYALILSAALCIFSGLIWLMMEQRLQRDIRRSLADEATRFEEFVQKEADEIPPVDLKDEIEEFCHALPASSYLELRPAPGSAATLTLQYPATAPAARGRYEVLKRTILIRNEP